MAGGIANLLEYRIVASEALEAAYERVAFPACISTA
jgi:hypothetical protein